MPSTKRSVYGLGDPVEDYMQSCNESINSVSKMLTELSRKEAIKLLDVRIKEPNC